MNVNKKRRKNGKNKNSKQIRKVLATIDGETPMTPKQQNALLEAFGENII